MYILILIISSFLLIGCNSSGSTPGQNGNYQTTANKTGIDFFVPPKPTYGYYVDAFGEAFMDLELQGPNSIPVGVEVKGANLGFAFATSEATGTFVLQSGQPPYLDSGKNNILIDPTGNTRNVNGTLAIRNFSPDVTDRNNAPILRSMSVYGFKERLMNGITIYRTKLYGYDYPLTLGDEDKILDYINSVYKQAILYFDGFTVFTLTAPQNSGNTDNILDVYTSFNGLGPEVLDLKSSIGSIGNEDNVGFYVNDFSVNYSFSTTIYKGTRVINFGSDISGEFSIDDRLTIGPKYSNAKVKCTETVQVASVNTNSITLRDTTVCEHPSPSGLINQDHFVWHQNSQSPLAVVFPTERIMLIEARSLNDVQHTIAHELGHLSHVGNFPDNLIPDNLMNTEGSGIHLRNDQWKVLNK